jgi:prophage antirepressor-like protein
MLNEEGWKINTAECLRGIYIMNEKIQIFQNPEFGNIRTMRDEKGEPLFCAKDVCDALGYDQTHKAVKRHVEEGDGTKRTTPTTSGIQQMLFINESGLYSLILSSKLEAARRFKPRPNGTRTGNTLNSLTV